MIGSLQLRLSWRNCSPVLREVRSLRPIPKAEMPHNLKRSASFRSIIAATNKDRRTYRVWWRLLAGLLFTLPVHTPAAAEDAPSVSTMLKEGWQIAGYTQAFDKSFHLHPLPPPRQSSLSGSVPGRLRRDAYSSRTRIYGEDRPPAPPHGPRLLSPHAERLDHHRHVIADATKAEN